MVYQIIYRSHSTIDGSRLSSSLREILANSERNNGRERVTGFLIFDKLQFMQLLEGEKEAVDATFDRISQDKRHSHISIVYKGEAVKRVFPDWNMGGIIRSPGLQHLFDKHAWSKTAEGDWTKDQFIALSQDVAQWEKEQRGQRGLSPR